MTSLTTKELIEARHELELVYDGLLKDGLSQTEINRIADELYAINAELNERHRLLDFALGN